MKDRYEFDPSRLPSAARLRRDVRGVHRVVRRGRAVRHPVDQDRVDLPSGACAAVRAGAAGCMQYRIRLVTTCSPGAREKKPRTPQRRREKNAEQGEGGSLKGAGVMTRAERSGSASARLDE